MRDRFQPVDRTWLEAERRKKGFMQKEVAAAAEMHATRYNRIECGMVDPTLREAFAISRMLGFDVNLFGDEKTLD